MKTLQKILLPLDFSDVAQNAVKHANTILEKHPGEVVFVYVNTPDQNLHNQEILANFRTFEEQVLRKTTFYYSFEVVQGELLHELAKATEKHQADLVIMGLKNRVSDVELASELMRMRKKAKSRKVEELVPA